VRALVVLLAVAGLAATPERTTGRLVVADADPGARLVTFTDAAGVTHVLPVRGEAQRMLSRLHRGDEVALSIGPEPGVADGPEVVLDIQTFPARSTVAGEADALREVQIAAAELATRADEMDREWSAFRETCLSTPTPSRDREWLRSVETVLPLAGSETCRRAQEDLTRRARRFQADVVVVTAKARGAGVPLIQIRETLKRHEIDIEGP
jgi:hypothetical protein